MNIASTQHRPLGPNVSRPVNPQSQQHTAAEECPKGPQDEATLSFPESRPTEARLKEAAIGGVTAAAATGAAYLIGQLTDPFIGMATSAALGAGGGALLASRNGKSLAKGALLGANAGLSAGMLMNSPEAAILSPLTRGAVATTLVAGFGYLNK